MALVLGRGEGQTIVMQTPEGRKIVVRVGEVRGNRVRLELHADREVEIRRGELEPREKETA